MRQLNTEVLNESLIKIWLNEIKLNLAQPVFNIRLLYVHYFIFLDSRWGIRSLFFILYLEREKNTETMRSHVAVFFFFRLLRLTFSFVIRCCMQKTSQLGSARKKKKSILLLSYTTWHTCFIFTIERVGDTLKGENWKLILRHTS